MKTLLFALLAAVITCSTVGCGKTTPQGYHLSARFNTAKVLKVDPRVMMGGRQIGQVAVIQFDATAHKFNLIMTINRSVVVKVDSVASINTSSSPDQSCITLSVGSSNAPAAAEGSILLSSE